MTKYGRADRDHDDERDRGLAYDVATLLSRRRALTLLGGAGLASLAACRSDRPKAPSPAASASASAALEQIPAETAGPFPGDGSNGVNVLAESGIVRSDITTSFGTGSATASGVPLTMKLKVLDIRNGAAPLKGAAVYLWHCDREGRYSLYSDGVTGENYLRGVQEADANGVVTFVSVFPAAYPGRWPHAHFEVYRSLTEATAAGDKLRTSQLALPADVSSRVYATKGYESSVGQLEATPIESDMVFSDGYSLQMATMTGDVASGLTATLNVPI